MLINLIFDTYLYLRSIAFSVNALRNLEFSSHVLSWNVLTLQANRDAKFHLGLTLQAINVILL